MLYEVITDPRRHWSSSGGWGACTAHRESRRKEGSFEYPFPYYGFVVKNLKGCVIVITSYSIHYTKLYEVDGKSNGQEWDCSLEKSAGN